MFTHIVVPIDRSGVAALALPMVRTLAQRTHASVCLLSVVPAHDPDLTRDAETQQRAYRQLLLVAGELNRDGIETAVAVREGNIAEQIVRYAEDMNADCICMATHDREGIDRFLTGSVAEQVLPLSAVPVLLLRPDVTPRPDASAAPILVPLDGSERAEVALPYAVGLAQAFGAPLMLVRVDDSTLRFPPDPDAWEMDLLGPLSEAHAERTEAEEYLTTVATRLRDNYADTRTHMLSGDPAAALADYAREVLPRYIVIGSRGRTGVARGLLGSTAAHLVHAAIAPVLIVTPRMELPESTHYQHQAGATPHPITG